MSLLIISDLHLTDKFNQKRFDELNDAFSKVDQVILNGDFWDSYRCSFDQFITSKWSNLFPLLLNKKTIYLYGNHDLKEDSDERVNLFSLEQGIFREIPWKDKILHIEHGNQLVPGFMENHFELRRNKIIFKILLTAHLIKEWVLETFLPSKIVHHKIDKKLKAAVIKNRKENEIWILGHSHLAEMDLEKGYINSGVNREKLQYIVVSDSQIKNSVI